MFDCPPAILQVKSRELARSAKPRKVAQAVGLRSTLSLFITLGSFVLTLGGVTVSHPIRRETCVIRRQGWSFLVLAGFAFILAGCDSRRIFPIQNKLLMQEEPSPIPFRTGPTPHDLTWIKHVTRISELFEVEYCLKLDAFDIAPLSAVTNVVRVGERYFLLDMGMKQVFSFSTSGEFLGGLGSVGQGPGEYEMASSITAWGEKLILFDGSRAMYIVFDKDGRYVSDFDGAALWINSLRMIAHGQRLYILGFSSPSAAVPYHAILGIDGEHFEAITGFGQRFKFAVSPMKANSDALNFKSIDSYALVGTRIWVGSPFETQLSAYDLEGRFVGRLNAGVDGLHEQDYGNSLTRSAFLKLQREKFVNAGLRVVGPLVIAYFAKGKTLATIYDWEGNIVVAGIEVDVPIFSPVARALDDRLVTPIPLSKISTHALDRLMGGAEGSAKLLEAGLDPAGTEEAMYLIFSKLRTKP